MTVEEASKAMERYTIERNELLPKIAEAARAVVPVLLDAGRVNSAKVLQELFFQLDANHQAMEQFVAENPRLAIQALMTKLGDR